MYVKLVLFFLIAGVYLSGMMTPVFVSASSMTHLVISQIQVEGDGGNNDEFIEIYNPTASPVSLNGWSLQYKSSAGNFPLTAGKKNLPDAQIAAGGYFLVAHTSYNGSVVADHIHSSFTISGSSSGATAFLVNGTTYLSSGSDSTIVDKVAYGSSSNNSPEGTAALVPPSEQALIRSSDTNNNAADFSVTVSNPRNSGTSTSPTPSPTPSPAPTPTPVPSPNITYSSDVVISEFLVNPDGSDSGEEWVELYNNYSGEIDLSGWILDDESSNGVPGSSAYELPEGTTIGERDYLVIELPEGAFALNNTGGDTLRLIWPNGLVANQVTYAESAPEDQTYAIKTNNIFAWTKIVTKGSANQFLESVPAPLSGESSDDFKIKINEIYPNPQGSDSGKEWIEVINIGATPISLHNWILDDGNKNDKIGSSAYRVESPIVNPGGIALIVIPAGSFSLNNTGKDTIRIFNPSKVLIDAVAFENSKENQSYALVGNNWVWTDPTPDVANVEIAEIAEQEINCQIIINEIFPEPKKGVEEFIELKNVGVEACDLTGWKLQDNAGSYTLKDFTLDPGEIKAVLKLQSKLSLNNYGQETVRLLNDHDGTIAEIEYEDPPKNQSYNLVESGEYVWSALVTPNKENAIKDGLVAGASLPRTGGRDHMWDSFVVFVVLWYIVGRKGVNGIKGQLTLNI